MRLTVAIHIFEKAEWIFTDHMQAKFSPDLFNQEITKIEMKLIIRSQKHETKCLNPKEINHRLTEINWHLHMHLHMAWHAHLFLMCHNFQTVPFFASGELRTCKAWKPVFFSLKLSKGVERDTFHILNTPTWESERDKVVLKMCSSKMSISCPLRGPFSRWVPISHVLK